jgi:hypothetical protein
MEDLSKLIPTAQEVGEKLALVEAEKASAAARKHAEAEAEKKVLLEQISKPSGVSEEERMKRAAAIIDYEFWNRHLRPRGYKLRVQIVDFPDGVPGDVGMTLKWV